MLCLNLGTFDGMDSFPWDFNRMPKCKPISLSVCIVFVGFILGFCEGKESDLEAALLTPKPPDKHSNALLNL